MSSGNDQNLPKWQFFHMTKMWCDVKPFCLRLESTPVTVRSATTSNWQLRLMISNSAWDMMPSVTSLSSLISSSYFKCLALSSESATSHCIQACTENCAVVIGMTETGWLMCEGFHVALSWWSMHQYQIVVIMSVPSVTTSGFMWRNEGNCGIQELLLKDFWPPVHHLKSSSDLICASGLMLASRIKAALLQRLCRLTLAQTGLTDNLTLIKTPKSVDKVQKHVTLNHVFSRFKINLHFKCVNCEHLIVNSVST